MTNKEKIIVGVVSLVLMLGLGYGVAHAQSSFWESVAKYTGLALANKVSLPEEVSNPTPQFQSLGGAGDTFAVQPIAAKIFTTSTESGTNTVSTTLVTIQNPTGGRTRIIKSITAINQGSSGTVLGGSLIMDFGTSTSQFATSSAPIYSTTYTTSTQITKTTTSTFSQGWNMVWQPGEYIYCATNRAVSSTGGFCEFDYINLN